MGYVWRDVIVDPTSDKASNAVGKVVYYADNPRDCLEGAKVGDSSYGVLQSLDLTDYLPFVVDGKHYECIVVKTTPAYDQNQAQWIADNGIKEGDCVKVLRKAREDEEDWGDAWVSGMDNYIGNVYKVTEIYPDGIELESDYVFPYFVLEKVSDKYVPFNSAEEFIARYSALFKKDPDTLTSAIWVKSTCNPYCLVIEIWDSGVVLGNGYDITYWEDLLKDWVFTNGIPCGKPKAVDPLA